MALNAWQKVEAEPEHNDSLCSAHGCPNRWAVDTGSRLCSAHAWAQPHEWPRITEAQYQKRKPIIDQTPPKRMTQEEKVATLHALRNLVKNPPDPKAWAHRLKAREQAGEHLTTIQREAWRTALRGHE
jgi:hypothetical protein